MPNKIKFSIVVLSFNSEKYLDCMLKSIDQSADIYKEKTELFVIDNGSVDKSVDILKNFQFKSPYAELKPIFLSKNYGTTYSRNLGLKESSGEYIVIMDSDAYMNAKTMISLCNYLSTHSDCGLIVPELTYPDGRSQISTDQFPTLYNKFKRFFFLKQMEKNTVDKSLHKVDYAISAFWMFPRKTLNAVGFLDEKIFYSPEDVDYCIRVWKAGYNIIYSPETPLIHDAQEISRPKGFKIINKFTLSHLKGLFYLFIKHRYFFSSKHLKIKND